MVCCQEVADYCNFKQGHCDSDESGCVKVGAKYAAILFFSGNKATRYGSEHEEQATNDYVTVKSSEGPTVYVHQSGLVVRPDEPSVLLSDPAWLACDSPEMGRICSLVAIGAGWATPLSV